MATIVQAGILTAAAVCLGAPLVVGLLAAQKLRDELVQRFGKEPRS
jgi:hypothetical protein